MTQGQAMIAGGIVTAALLIALFFLRFWRASRDPLFAWFAAAFVLQALARLAPALPIGNDQEMLLYVLRLCSYLLIVAAIWSKNRAPRRAMGRRERPR
jgi:hypothetical protein